MVNGLFRAFCLVVFRLELYNGPTILLLEKYTMFDQKVTRISDFLKMSSFSIGDYGEYKLIPGGSVARAEIMVVIPFQ